MKLLPAKILEFVNSPERVQIFDILNSLEDGFTIKDVHNDLELAGSRITLPTIQNFLTGLSNRGYLKQSTVKLGHTRGRSTIHFTRNEVLPT
jgi:Fe2+ or Zn2+ uptake regulation protein